MKKILSILLTIAIVFGLCACGGSGNNNENKPAECLQVGFSKIDVTPDFSVGLEGYADTATRRSEGIFSYIYITCIAMSEAGETILLYTLDFASCYEGMTELIRKTVSEATGIPQTHIFAGATHNHSAPSPMRSDPECLQYREIWLAAVVDSAKEALKDLAPASVLSAQPEIENMNFVRHYKMSDGTHAGSNFGSFTDSQIEGHSVEGDHKMTLVKFDRPEGKDDILLVNWAAHPDHGNKIGRNNIGADYPGALRDKVESETGLKVAFFSGASGNMNPDSKIPAEQHGLDVVQYGERLADYAIAALPTLAPVEGSGIKTMSASVTLDVDHSWDHMIDEAKEVYELSNINSGSANALGKQYNFSSYHQARMIIARYSYELTQDKNIHAFCVGGLGFISGDYEMFTETGMFIKENSPFTTTFIVTGNTGYLATEAAYDYRSYEADTATFAKGSAEKLGDKFVELLKALA